MDTKDSLPSKTKYIQTVLKKKILFHSKLIFYKALRCFRNNKFYNENTLTLWQDNFGYILIYSLF